MQSLYNWLVLRFGEKKFFSFTGCDNAHYLILKSEDISDAYKRVKTGPQQSRIFLQFVSEILFKKKRHRNIFVKG